MNSKRLTYEWTDASTVVITATDQGYTLMITVSKLALPFKAFDYTLHDGKPRIGLEQPAFALGFCSNDDTGLRCRTLWRFSRAMESWYAAIGGLSAEARDTIWKFLPRRQIWDQLRYAIKQHDAYLTEVNRRAAFHSGPKWKSGDVVKPWAPPPPVVEEVPHETWK